MFGNSQNSQTIAQQREPFSPKKIGVQQQLVFGKGFRRGSWWQGNCKWEWAWDWALGFGFGPWAF